MTVALDAVVEEGAMGAIQAPPRGGFHPSAWRYLLGFYRSRWRSLVGLFLVAVAQALILIPLLFCVRLAIDVAIGRRDVTLLVLLGLGVLGARVVSAILALVARSIGASVAKTAVAQVRLDLIRRLYGLSREFHGASEAGRTYARIAQYTERVDQATTNALSDAGPAIVVMIGMLAWLVHLNAWLVLMAAPVAAIGWFAARLARQHVRREVRIFYEAYERFSKGVLFVLAQMDLTKARGFEAGELRRQGEMIDAASGASRDMAMSYAIYSQTQSLIGGVGAVVILVGGGVAIVHGAFTVGNLIAFLAAAAIFNTQLSRVIGLAPDLIAAEESVARIQELGALGPPEPYGEGGQAIAFSGRVALRDVDIGFRGRPVLSQVSLEIAPGETVAIVGANGAGKSTLLNLILGFLRPSAGAVYADQHPYDAIDLRALRREIGLVPQKPTFFFGTVAENIAYGWPNVEREEIVAAAQWAGAGDFVRGLPKGYDTEIGEGGVLVSGGEAQRLAIARAVIGRPKLLILDEPTNHLDAEAVRSIMAHLLRGPARMAVILASHDPSVVDLARTVYRLENGALTRVRGQ
ncbi:MAG TPA: ABC transporter ATP-binding protein [Caulobacteraceae bacterium]|jgi:ABC-type bacteriocin/lantibiotic exporter with double-glycine peptidase domain|nr:ABC transporter ATP-binding protein [Caulobacteraceae bacterium]